MTHGLYKMGYSELQQNHAIAVHRGAWHTADALYRRMQQVRKPNPIHVECR